MLTHSSLPHTNMLSADELIAKLRAVVTCPICLGILRDPTIITTCQDCFCFDCINRGIENGCAPCERPYTPTATCDEVDEASKPTAKKRRAKRVKFQCPVCGLAAYKFLLQRVPVLSAYIERVRLHLAVLPFSAVPSVPTLTTTAQQLNSKPSSPRESTKRGRDESVDENDSAFRHEEPPVDDQSYLEAADAKKSSISDASSVLFEESMPFWQLAAASANDPPTPPSCLETVPQEGHPSPLLTSSCSMVRIGHDSSLLASFMRTPPPQSSRPPEQAGNGEEDTEKPGRGEGNAHEEDTQPPGTVMTSSPLCPSHGARSNSQEATVSILIPEAPTTDDIDDVAVSASCQPSSLSEEGEPERTDASRTPASVQREHDDVSPIHHVPHVIRIVFDESVWRFDLALVAMLRKMVADIGGAVVLFPGPWHAAGSAADRRDIERVSDLVPTHIVARGDGHLPFLSSAACETLILARRCTAMASLPQIVSVKWICASHRAHRWLLQDAEMEPFYFRSVSDRIGFHGAAPEHVCATLRLPALVASSMALRGTEALKEDNVLQSELRKRRCVVVLPRAQEPASAECVHDTWCAGMARLLHMVGFTDVLRVVHSHIGPDASSSAHSWTLEPYRFGAADDDDVAMVRTALFDDDDPLTKGSLSLSSTATPHLHCVVCFVTLTDTAADTEDSVISEIINRSYQACHVVRKSAAWWLRGLMGCAEGGMHQQWPQWLSEQLLLPCRREGTASVAPSIATQYTRRNRLYGTESQE